MSYGYNDSFVGGQPPVQVQRVGGWKLMLGAMLGALGFGFAGYVYLGPYQTVNKALRARTAELGLERDQSDGVLAERDKLKAEMNKRSAVERDKAMTESKKQQEVDTFIGDLKVALGAFGASLSSGGGRAEISFPATSMFEQKASTVISAQGEAALKILSAALKKAGFRSRVMAKLISAPPPRELAQFKNIGEFAMLRAVRVALALNAGGVGADRVAAAGEAALPGAHKGKPAVPDRLEIEIEPE